MAYLIVNILTWAVWWGSLAAILNIDQSRRDAAAKAADTVNFQERGLLPYLMLGLFCGAPLVLPMYFYATRKSYGAALLGLAIGAGITLVAGVVHAVASMVLLRS